MNALGQLIGVLFVVGLIIRYFWWIAAVAGRGDGGQVGAASVGAAQGGRGSVEGGTARDRRQGRPAARLGDGGRPARDVRLYRPARPIQLMGTRLVGSLEVMPNSDQRLSPPGRT